MKLLSVPKWTTLKNDPSVDFKIYIPSSWQMCFERILLLCRTTQDIMLLLAPEGGGKTTFTQQFVQTGLSIQLSPSEEIVEKANDHFKKVLVSAEPQDTFSSLMKKVACGFGQPWGNESTFEMLLNKHLYFILVVDNADCLNDDTLYSLLSWSKIEKKSKNFNLVLAALPAFEGRLASQSFWPLVQNTLQILPIEPFTITDVFSFIKWMKFTPMQLNHDDIISVFEQSLGNPKKLKTLIKKTVSNTSKKAKKSSPARTSRSSKKNTFSSRIANSFKHVFLTFENKGSSIKSFFQILIAGSVLGLGLGCVMIYYFYMQEDAQMNANKTTSEVKLDLIPKEGPNLQQFLEPMLDLHHAAGESTKPLHPVLSPVDEDRDIEAEEDANLATKSKALEAEQKSKQDNDVAQANRQAFLENTEKAFGLARTAVTTTEAMPVPEAEVLAVPAPLSDSNLAPVVSSEPVMNDPSVSAMPNENLSSNNDLNMNENSNNLNGRANSSLDLDLDDLVLSRAKDHYTVQILGTQSSREMMSIYKQYQNQMNLLYANTPHEDGDWFVLVSGDYATREEAVAALANLPEPFKKNNPWIRSWGNIHENMMIHQ